MCSTRFPVRVPLPPFVDNAFEPWPVTDKYGNSGMQLSHFDENYRLRRRIETGRQPVNSPANLLAQYPYEVAKTCLDRNIMLNGRRDIQRDISSGRMIFYVDVCPFPQELWPSAHRTRTSGQYLIDFISDLAPLQVDWFYNMRRGDPDKWGLGNCRNPEWIRWKNNPRLECVWIVAIRRTLPDANGVVCYFPELEIRV